MWAIDHNQGSLKQYLEEFNQFKTARFRESKAHAFVLHSQELPNLFGLSRHVFSSLICEENDEFPCQLCDGCKSLNNKNPLRFLPIFPQGQNISIQAVREIQEACKHKLEDSQKQLIAIFFPSLLQTEAANALLKTLEEPGAGRIFVLVNPYTQFLLPTVSSRLHHLHLPSNQVIYSRELDPLDEDFLKARICDFPIFGENSRLDFFLQNPMSLAPFYSWLLEKIKDSENPFELILDLQLMQAYYTGARRLAVINFLERLASEEFRFLDREVSSLKKVFKDLQDCLSAAASRITIRNRDELGVGFEHWLLKDFKAEKVTRYFRGFLYREIESLFIDFLRTFENLFLNQDSYALLPQEKLLGSQFANYQYPSNLHALGQKLAESNRMLYNNVPWDALLEELAVSLLQSQSSR